MHQSDRGIRRFAWAMLLSILAGVAALFSLIWVSGPWSFIANTRLLDLMISAGIIKYHDNQIGFIGGVANLDDYLKSQDPVRWDLVAVVIVIFLLFFALKAIQHHGLARLFGLRTSAGQNVRAFSYALLVEKLLPFELGDVAAATALQREGAPLERAKAVVFTGQLFVVFEIVVFAVIGLLFIGWSEWLGQVFWALAILALVVVWLRRPRGQRPDRWKQVREIGGVLAERPLDSSWLALLSLLAFGLEDIAAYFTAMAFSADNVLLHVDFSLLLMGVVGSYVARLVRFTPGGIGQFEWGFAAALWIGGVGLPECVTIAVLDNVFRYLAAAIFYGLTTRRDAARARFSDVVRAFYRGREDPEPADMADAAVAEDAPMRLPTIDLPRLIPAAALWRRGLVVASVLLAGFFLDQITLLFFDLWVLESLGLSSVFWTNFGMAALLFVVGVLTMMVPVGLPAFTNPLSRAQRGFVVHLAVLAGCVGGYFLALTYLNFLFSTGEPFGRVDPVFDKDVGFYVYSLPAIWVGWTAVIYGASLGFISAVVCGSFARATPELPELNRLQRRLAVLARPSVLGAFVWLGVVAAAGEWLTRYDILFKDNEDVAVVVGASYVDVVGLFSHLNHIYVTAFVILAATVALALAWRLLGRALGGAIGWQLTARRLGWVVLALVLFDFGFKGVVAVRDWIGVRPNAPVIQLPWIQRHIEATRAGYGLEDFELVEFIPKTTGDPVPDIEDLLASPTIKNAPLWPGFTADLERYLDPQHAARILQTSGDSTVYGPTLEVFRQQQKLRTYYDFLGVDAVRYRINGEKRMFVSSVRETPLMAPDPWLGWFGQRFMLFTHGYGLVVAPVAETAADGTPRYVVRNIPEEVDSAELQVANPRVYYGEGSTTIAYSNVDKMKELDFPTRQDRAEMVLEPGVGGGVKIDSLLKRLVFGWRSAQFFEVVFSDLITDETRVHLIRTPLERLECAAPFIYYDSNPYAVVADDQIVWMVNGLTTSERFPFSTFQDLGDKSDERAVFPREHRRINYVEDSVKATVDAFSGAVRLYKIADRPVINTWAKIYPELFVDGDTMPEEVRAQLTYPVHLFHIQFDDVYILYHMNDPMYFFNMEDMWDDGDEVLGPILDNGDAITFSIEPYTVLVETGAHGIPATVDPVQFTLSLVFTPENALNLRAIPLAFQDGEDYGRVVVLQVPKGLYAIGPEQADATIDQDPKISEQISWWNRLGTDVIRGHTTALLVEGEVIYVEPIFIRSQQNPVTQLRRVVVVFRGIARMGATLEEALRAAVAAVQESVQQVPVVPADEELP